MNDGFENFDLMKYATTLWLLTGFLLLRLDAVGYKIEGMTKEYWFSKCLGWINIAIGAGCFLWFYIAKLFG